MAFVAVNGLCLDHSTAYAEAGDKLRENQAGFHQGRGCTFQIFSLKLLMEKCLEFQVPAMATFVDFEAAFDSVHRPS